MRGYDNISQLLSIPNLIIEAHPDSPARFGVDTSYCYLRICAKFIDGKDQASNYKSYLYYKRWLYCKLAVRFSEPRFLIRGITNGFCGH